MEAIAQESAPAGWSAALAKPSWAVAVILLVWACAYLPGLGVRDLRLEEGRRATPAAEMYTHGDYVVPRLYGQPYLNKPPLFFWMATGVAALQGRADEFSVRIPSVLSVLGGALLLLHFGRRELSLRTRAIAALIFLSMPFMLDKGTLGEIDAVLSFWSFAAVAVLWNAWDARRGRFGFAGWLWAGVMLALATLTKGPGGVAEFYAMLVPFLALSGKGRWKNLYSAGHGIMLVIAVAPALVWVQAVSLRAGMSWAELLSLWRQQTGLASGSMRQGEDLVMHYLAFPWRVFSMLLPWGLYAIAGLFPAFGRRFVYPASLPEGQREPTRDLWMLLVPALPALLAIFWLMPTGNPRYLMMAAYPVATLAAMALSGLTQFLPGAGVMRLWRSISLVLPIVVIGGCIAVVIVAAMQVPSALISAGVTAAACAGFALAWLHWSRREELCWAPIAGLVGVALLMALGRGLLSSVLLPYVAPRDAVRIVHDQIRRIIPPADPVYTTRTFKDGRGDTYYNLQFYLAGDWTPASPGGPRALMSWNELPPDRRVTVVLTPDAWDDLKKQRPDARILGRLEAEKGPPPLLVAQVGADH